jgi:hypothetical protein
VKTTKISYVTSVIPMPRDHLGYIFSNVVLNAHVFKILLFGRFTHDL